MKRIIFLNLVLLLTGYLSFGQESSPKKIETDTIHVSGNCGECKERIEKAAYLPGVKRAEWNRDTKQLIVSFRTSKVSLQQIEENIANAGHDAGDIKASEEAYNKLPTCCAYREEEDH